VFLDDYQLPAMERAGSFFLRNLGWVLEEVSRWDDLLRWAVLRTSTGPPTLDPTTSSSTSEAPRPASSEGCDPRLLLGRGWVPLASSYTVTRVEWPFHALCWIGSLLPKLVMAPN